MSLPNFGRRKVKKAQIVVRKVGGGLDEPMRFEPVALWPGDEIYLITKAVVVDVHHPAENRKSPAEDDIVRVHITDAIEVAMVTADEAEPLLKAADERLHEFRLAESLAAEKAHGIERLDIEPE